MEEPDGFSVLSHVAIPKLGYDQPSTTYTLVEIDDPNTGQWSPLFSVEASTTFQSPSLSLPRSLHPHMHYCFLFLVTGTFLNTLKFTVKDCDPNTGEPDDDVGYADEYVVSFRMG